MTDDTVIVFFFFIEIPYFWWTLVVIGPMWTADLRKQISDQAMILDGIL